MPVPSRWVAVSMFALYSSLNFLDRQTLAALAPQIRAEFQLSHEQYGYILSAFSIAYALTSPGAGLLVDRLGLTIGAIVTLAVWSFAGIATGFTSGLAGLLACRIVLGMAEAGGIPAFGKANATYLEPRERSLGAGLNQAGISLGNIGAPLLAGWVAIVWGWRAAFAVTGAIGLLWIPLWLYVRSRVPPRPTLHEAPRPTLWSMVRDRRLIRLIFANMLVMTVYSLWTNWTTEYLVTAHGMKQADANWQLAWIPPIFATLGGIAGGSLVWRFSKTGMSVPASRLRVVFMASLLIFVTTAAVPFMPNATFATAAMCASFFAVLAVSVNVYAMPLELFGSQGAAFAVSAITFGYGVMQAFYSPLVGRIVGTFGFAPVCILSALCPFLGYLLLRTPEPER